MATPADHLIRAIAPATDLRIIAAMTTGVVAEGARRHAADPTATCALGRALTSGLLMATLTKGGERVTVQIVGSGPLGSLTVDASDDGDVRGYVLHPQAGGPLADGRGYLARAVGKKDGVVNVVRDLGLKERYQGQVGMVTGEIDEDVEAYLRISEQVPSALGCEVILDETGQVVSAAGLLVQALPGGDPASVREVQHALRSGELYRLLLEGERSATKLAEALYPASPIEVLGEARPVRFACRCSQERIADMLSMLGIVELDDMIASSKAAEVTCNFCNQVYRVERPQLEEIRLGISGPRESN